MKKHFYFPVILLFVTGMARAQNIGEVVTKEYVNNLMKTLTNDDMQGRRTFTPGIEKAATFISGEFKKIGLQPLTGAADYQQIFYKYQLNPLKTVVSIDKKAINPADVLVLGNSSETVSFNQSNSDGWMKLDTSKAFRPQFLAVLASKKRQVVLVGQKFAADFHRMQYWQSVTDAF